MRTLLRLAFLVNPVFGVLAGLCGLWCSPGLRAQPRLFKEISPLTAPCHALVPGSRVPAHRKLHLDAAPPMKDIHPGAREGLDIRPGSRLAGVGNTVFFVANDGIAGVELWKSDGTGAGKVLVRDIRPGSLGANPSNLVELNGTLYFVANDGVNGNELWKSDGTEAGTVLVKDLRPGPAGVAPGHLAVFRNHLYFVANDGRTGRELWKSDGTAAGTVLVKDINRGPVNSNPGQLFDVNGSLYFIAEDAPHGRELWKSDGTAAGTVLVRDILPGAGSGFPYYAVGLTPVGNTLHFTADDGLNGRKCWRSDGTTAGTVRTGDSCPGPGFGSSPTLTHGNKSLRKGMEQ